MKAYFFKYNLEFNTPAKTSRDILFQKPSWFIVIKNQNEIGIGECSIIPGLSIDDLKEIENKLDLICNNISSDKTLDMNELRDFPAVKFALETAQKDLMSSGKTFKLFESDFSNYIDNIKINGLVWMGDINHMKLQIKEKINNGFSCIKIKVGALQFKSELELIKKIRKDFKENNLEIRLDANGAFNKTDALEKLNRLSEFSIHSIEQPIKTKQWQEMAGLCESSPIPIALDEELIGINFNKKNLIETINPNYLILKPSLLGGFSECEKWIKLADEKNIKWWATSALESNVGLNAIAQWVYTKNNDLRQGLRTGMLFKNNIKSQIEILGDTIFLNRNKKWDLSFFKLN